MKIIRIAVALASVLVLGVLAVSAFGQDNTIWLCAGLEILNLPERCLILSENLETFVFYDLTADSEVECPTGVVMNEGWVGPGSEDEITLITFLSPGCTPTAKALNLKEESVTNVCEKVENTGLPTPVNFPAPTLLLLRAGVTYDEIGGTAGYAITCKTALGNVTDTCQKEASQENNLEALNLPGNATEFPLVSVLFTLTPVVSDAERVKCSVGGKESGALEGEILLQAFGSSGSEVSLETADVNEP